jgi:hypothetical protein
LPNPAIYTKPVYEAVYACAKKVMNFTATKNRVIVHHDLLWPAAVAGIRPKNGRHSQMSDFAVKASAKAIPTSKMLRSRYGDTIIDDITCPLCGAETDTIEHLPDHSARARRDIQPTSMQNCTHHQPNDKENRKMGEVMLEGHEKEVDAIAADGAHLCWLPHARVQTANASHGTNGEPSRADWQRHRNSCTTGHIQPDVESTQRGNACNRTHAIGIPKTSRKSKGSSAGQTTRGH